METSMTRFEWWMIRINVNKYLGCVAMVELKFGWDRNGFEVILEPRSSINLVCKHSVGPAVHSQFCVADVSHMLTNL